MKKRVVAASLWFLAVWYGWSILTFVVGVPEALGPLLGLATAVLVVTDPGQRIWRSGPTTVSVGRQVTSEG